MAEFLKVLSFEQAKNILSRFLPSVGSENIPLLEARGRTLAADIIAEEDIPAFNRSTVDGYALRGNDTFGCSESLPAYLELCGEINMGENPQLSLNSGQCAWIPTGGVLPDGADTVVMVEYTERLGEDTILVYRPVGPGENIMRIGDDLAYGSRVLSLGHILRPQDIGLLASIGKTTVEVKCSYQTAVISTGNEIVPVSQRPQIGQVRDVNTYSLCAALQSAGCSVNHYPIVPDDTDILRNTVQAALDDHDVIFISGGSSVGLMDVTLKVLMSLPEAKLLFHGIAIKPGKPTLAVHTQGKLIIGLPGHPVSALTVFNVLCRPLFKQASNYAMSAELAVNLASQAGRDDFIPVQIDYDDHSQKLMAVPLLGKSGLMSVLAKADGLIHVPSVKQGLLAGEQVTILYY